MKAWNFVIVLLGLAMSGVSSAALVTTEMTLEVTQSAHSNISAGDELFISTLFDNESTRFTTYRDGVNQLAEFGGGDDFYAFTTCAHTDPQAYINSSCTVTHSDIPSASDAQTDLSSLFSLVESSERGSDARFESRDIQYVHNSTGYNYINVWADDYFFFTSEVSGWIDTFAMVQGVHTRFRTEFTVQNWETRSNESVEVSEPPSIALLASGIAGLGFVSNRKKRLTA